LSNGASYYIAPKDYPDGSASLLFLINFYYYLAIKNKSPREALNLAQEVDGDIEMYQYFDNETAI